MFGSGSGRTAVKFCGITRTEDAVAAARLGAWAIGLVQVPESPRFIGLREAAMIRARLPGAVKVVVLFRNAQPQVVEEAIRVVAPDLLQFHGEETPADCIRYGLPYLRAVPMAQPQDLAAWSARYPTAVALLLDSHAPGGQGGQGRAFDWTTVATRAGPPLVLAGGLTPHNVAQAVRTVRPRAVDVSSGIESAPGVKDPAKMQRFIDEVRRADAG